MFVARLKPGRERSVLQCHPWVFASAIAEVGGLPAQGETIKVISAKGEFLAWGAYSPNSQIRIRIWSWQPDEIVNRDFIHSRLRSAISLRQMARLGEITNAIRLVHGESDGLPGLVVDQYDDYLVVQFLSSGSEKLRELIVDCLVSITGLENVYERSDVDVRELEGLPTRTGRVRGIEPPELIQLHEHDLKYWLSIRSGHKTGFYLDQRFNRGLLRDYAFGRDVLDCFSFTGGFAINALSGGAKSVEAVDISGDVLSLNKQNVLLNSLDFKKINWIEGDVFSVLRNYRDQGRTFDLIILDPPKFAPTVSQVERAIRGYKDINLLALKLLRSDGFLFSFSCSGGVQADLFQKIIRGAALDAGADCQIIKSMRQDVDHPVALNFPEGDYLKGLLVRKLN